MQIETWFQIMILLGAISTAAALIDNWTFRFYALMTIPAFLIGCVYFAVYRGQSELLFTLPSTALSCAILVVPYTVGVIRDIWFG